jgi:hypothetical protein
MEWDMVAFTEFDPPKSLRTQHGSSSCKYQQIAIFHTFQTQLLALDLVKFTHLTGQPAAEPEYN